MSLRRQIAGLFLEPPAVGPEPVAPEPETRWLPPCAAGEESANARACVERVTVVGRRRDVRVAAAAVGLALVRGAAGRVLVLEWTGTDEALRERPSGFSARRAAARLREQGHAAAGVGRLVWVSLPAREAEAAAEALAILRGPDPAVLVIAGPRGPEIEEVAAGTDRILLAVGAGADPEVASLAAAELGAQGTCVTLELASSPAAAALARSGTALVAPLKDAVHAALGDRD